MKRATLGPRVTQGWPLASDDPAIRVTYMHCLFDEMLRINKPYRSQDQAQALLGREVIHGGTTWRVVEYNDLGVLYWQVHDRAGKPKGKQFYNADFDRRLAALA